MERAIESAFEVTHKSTNILLFKKRHKENINALLPNGDVILVRELEYDEYCAAGDIRECVGGFSAPITCNPPYCYTPMMYGARIYRPVKDES
jgi:hypothetical protein